VAGFHAWRKLGRFVRRSEKGIAILAPITARQDPDAADGESKSVVGFRAAYVFVAQTDGAPPLAELTERQGLGSEKKLGRAEQISLVQARYARFGRPNLRAEDTQ
jgi:hypothetical protein